MKKTINWMLMALLVVGIGMNLSSCKEDELSDEEKAWREADPYEKGSDEALDFWTVISQLTDLQALPNDWKTATFEPTIGVASETDPYTRNVVVQDAAEAVAAYSSLIGLAESLPDYTSGNNYSNNRVGTLNYARSRDGQSVATVEVSIKQMPKLKKIVYMTPEQAGENATLHGSAYYHFGDVIRRVNKSEDTDYWEYWICVNPASHLTGKTESHWISVSDLPDENVYTWKRSDGQVVKLPTAICTQYTYIHDFAELLYAICDPQKYFGNLGGDMKLPIFSGYSRKNQGYLNQYYFTRISRAWEENGLFYTVLTRTMTDLQNLTELSVFCKGYSWVMGKTGTLYTYTYSGPNWKTATWSKPTYNFKDTSKPAFNIHYWGLAGEGNGDWQPHKAFVVRHATGEALCKMAGASYHWQNKISGCEDVYVYNKYWYPNTQDHMYDLGYEPEVLTQKDVNPNSKPISEVTKEDFGKVIGRDGMIYNSREDAQKARTQAVAMVLGVRDVNYEFLGDGYINQDGLETNVGKIKTGFAIALEDGNYDENKEVKEVTSVSIYDPTWDTNHSVPGATWYVPNYYHWQRMLFPYGLQTIMRYGTYMYSYLFVDGASSVAIPEGTRLYKDLEKLGAGLCSTKKVCDYMIAGTTALNSDNLEVPITMNVTKADGKLCWSIKDEPDCVRYVLTW